MSPIQTPTSPKLRLLLATAGCGLAAFAAAVASISTISLLPPKIEPRHLDVAAAGARVIVDYRKPLVSDNLASDGDFQTLQKRAVLMGSLMATDPVLVHIARRAKIDADQLVARARITANVQGALTDPDSERRAEMLRTADVPYRLDIQPDPLLPVLSVYSGAPTVAEAERLADAAAAGLRDYLRQLAIANRKDPNAQVTLEQPGRARGASINGGAQVEIFGLTFVFVFTLVAFALMLVARLRRLASGRPGVHHDATTDRPIVPRRPDPAPAPRRPRPSRMPAFARRLGLTLTPAVAVVPAGAAVGAGTGVFGSRSQIGVGAISRREALKAGDWPRTTRVLPWMIALMGFVIWLTPFNLIQLSIPLPIDLKLDRLILPFIIATWLLTIAAGARGAPRVRLTAIHYALGGVAVAALLSLVLEARSLSQSLELETSVKKLVLLASYISLFLVVSSSIRRGEVKAFLKYTLALALVCALGTIYEYRFEYNVFYSMAQLLPPIFTVPEAESSALDQIGRRVVRGPGEVPLETVAMLSMGLGIAVVGLIHAKVPRERVFYGIATALILAAAASTERKSALMAPASVFVTLAYFRRRELIRMAPIGVVIGVLMLALTPGAAQSVVNQLSGNNLKVNTVSDRSSDYDAVRPDVFSHLAFGRGYGSYEPQSYRILDMELLRQLIEVGIFGLIAFVVMLGSIVAVARRPIRERKPQESAVALSAAAAAVALLVVSALFDSMAFPHCPYIALWMAGMLAVIVVNDREDDREGAWSS